MESIMNRKTVENTKKVVGGGVRKETKPLISLKESVLF